LIDICREYVIGIRCELARKETTDPVRQAELAAYFTNSNLQPVHMILVLRSAMSCALKVKNTPIAASFARRLIDTGAPAAVQQAARKVLAAYDAAPNANDGAALRYDPRNPFVVCGRTLLPLYRGAQIVRCPLCSQPVEAAAKGQVCDTCCVAQIGAEASGMRWVR